MTLLQGSPDFRLLPCDADGALSETGLNIPEFFRSAAVATADLYKNIGFVPPWIGYAAVSGQQVVGGGAFVGPAKNGEAEIAYFTVPEFEGQGFAGQTAAHLLRIVREENPAITVFAKTLPEENPSTRILRSLAFHLIGETTDDEVGTAWRWEHAACETPLKP